MSQAYNALLELPLPDGDDDEDADFAREDALFTVREMLIVAKVKPPYHSSSFRHC